MVREQQIECVSSYPYSGGSTLLSLHDAPGHGHFCQKIGTQNLLGQYVAEAAACREAVQSSTAEIGGSWAERSGFATAVLRLGV